MRRHLRRALLGAATLLLLGVAGVVAVQMILAGGTINAQVDAALERATGRAVSSGVIEVRPGLRPRVVLTEARIANIPGGTQPDFARIGRLEVTMALLPLLAGKVEIDSLHLSDAEILLERDAEGRPNWDFGAGSGGGIAVAAIEIERTRLLLPQAPVRQVEIERLRLSRDTPEDPLSLRGHLRLDDEALAVEAELGPGGGDLPLRAGITGEGLRLDLRGTWPRSTEAPGWSLAIRAEASGEAARRLAARAGHEIPAVGPLRLDARLAPGSPWPAVSDLVLRLGPIDGGRLLPGLQVTKAELRAETFDAPARLSAHGRRNLTELGLMATLPSLHRLLAATAAEPLPVEATFTSDRSRLTLAGDVRGDRGLGATAFAARLTTPDFAAIGPLLGAPLPRLRGMTAEGRMSGLFTSTLRLQGLRVGAEGLDAEGELDIALSPRPGFRGRVAARRFDLDALGGGRAPAHGAARVIPDIPLPTAMLRGADAELRLSAASLIAGGIAWRDVQATVALRGGRLTVDPLALTTPGGRMSGRLAVDAAATPPQASLALRSQGSGLDLSALRRALGVPSGFEGSAELALDLRGRGATTRALAATLTGDAGIAMLGGRFTGATALRIGPDLARVLMPRGTPSGGLALRCLAIRLSAQDGLAESQAMLMEGEFGRIEGSLAANLRDEAIVARLLPDLRVMGVTVRAPVTVGGTLAAPRVGMEPGAAFARVVGDTVANRLWRSSTVEFLRGATGSSPPGEDCAAALALARLGRAGPVPEAAAVPIPLVPRELQGTVQEVVRGIGGLLGGRRR